MPIKNPEFSVKLDMVHNAVDPSEDISWDQFIENTQRWADGFGPVKVEVVHRHGPGGGNPNLRFTGPKDAIQKLCLNRALGDEHEAAYYMSMGETV